MGTQRTFEQAIGAELQRQREAAGVTQDAVATTARGLGFAWGQATISAIEAGRRAISVGELGLLLFILAAANVTSQPTENKGKSHGWMTMARVVDLIPDADEWVTVADGVEVNLASARWLFGTDAERRANVQHGYYRSVRPLPSITEADRKAARTLRVAPEAVVYAARGQWGRSLAEERDERVGTASASAQKRGRVTRKLIAELRPHVQRTRKRKGGK
jgi:transcriptional regulator with XRE-family HTH domain